MGNITYYKQMIAEEDFDTVRQLEHYFHTRLAKVGEKRSGTRLSNPAIDLLPELSLYGENPIVEYFVDSLLHIVLELKLEKKHLELLKECLRAIVVDKEEFSSATKFRIYVKSKRGPMLRYASKHTDHLSNDCQLLEKKGLIKFKKRKSTIHQIGDQLRFELEMVYSYPETREQGHKRLTNQETTFNWWKALKTFTMLLDLYFHHESITQLRDAPEFYYLFADNHLKPPSLNHVKQGFKAATEHFLEENPTLPRQVFQDIRTALFKEWDAYYEEYHKNRFVPENADAAAGI